MNDESGAAPQRGLSRRGLLATGATAFAFTVIPGAAARAAQATKATTEPATTPPEGRVLACLNGAWDFMPTTGAPATPPVTGAWNSIPVPAEWNMTAGNFATSWDAYDLFETPAGWDDVNVAWYRRTVEIPAGQRGNRIVVQFGAVNFEATVFFNDTLVTTHRGGLLPFEADVTDQVNWTGTNTIHVLVTSGTQAALESDGWHYPNGSWWGQTCWGIWQDVWLVARPQTYISDVYIVTSVTSNMLTVTTTLTNAGTSGSTVRVTHRVGGTPIQGTTQVAVPAGSSTTVTFTRSWSNPRLWNQQDPHLYQLEVTAGKDSYTTRFGFREIAVSGTSILLNGEAVTLRGDAWHFMGSVENSRAYVAEWFTLVKQAGINYLRLHAMPYPPVFYDVADEMGMLIVGESGVYGSSGNYALGASDFWDNCHTHLTARIIRDRNHPSIFAWSVENEMLAAFGQGWAAQVAALKPVAVAVDTTRPIYFEGDGDPGGAGDLESTHYPLEITTGNTAIPESAYALAPGQSDAGFWDRAKPMLIGEFSSMYYATPDDVSAVGGPATYADLTGLYSAHELIVGAQIEGFRYAGVTGLSPWNTVWYGLWHQSFDPARESLPAANPDGPRLLQVGPYATTLNPGFQPDLPPWDPNPIHASVARTMPGTAALATDYRAHFWGGATLTRTYAVYSDQGPVTVEVELRLAGGPAVRQSQPASAGDRVTFNLTVPTVSKITPGTLTVRAGSYQHQATLSAYPPSAAQRTTSTALSALVYSSDGSTATSDALASLGVTTTAISDLSTLPTGSQILVLAEGSTVSPTEAETTALIDFIRAGGKVLSLAQAALPQILPWPVLTGGTPATIAHVVAPHHPVLTGIGAADLRWWNTPSEIVLSQGMLKPRYGSWKSIADVGQGLATSALAEAAYGSGTCVLCQFPVIAAAANEPVAAILLRNMLDYLATRPAPAGQALGVITPSGSNLASTLTGAAVEYSTVTEVSAAALTGLGALLVDASSSASVSAVTAGATALSAWLSAGGTLWVNGLASATALGPVLPSDLTLASLDAAHQYGAVTTGKSALVDGLNNADLDWTGSAAPLVTQTVAGSGGTSAIDSRA
ncbi:MAG TPA: glycoside hydrolase family 2 TIM barrel-domain containing protein, partial [Trebonia sp.]|nr:glycoside hydrolase family 2 TIM barrel-domain containing protein [Trebonia sp.]